MDCLFCRVVNKEIPADIIFEDDEVLAFKDIKPKAATHILIIPKKHIATLIDVTDPDANTIGHLTVIIGQIARQLGVDQGFKVVINNGASAGQVIPHVHFHLLAGRLDNIPV